MTQPHLQAVPPVEAPARPWPTGDDTGSDRLHGLPVALGHGGRLVCDAQTRVLLIDEAGRHELAGGRVLALRADGTLGVRSDGAGLLALRGAVRQVLRGGARQVLTLRHGPVNLTVAVLPWADGGRLAALLVLRPD